MDEEEINLWKICNLPEYGVYTTCLRLDVENVVRKISCGKKGFYERLSKADNLYNKLSKAYETIDLDLFDGRFPVKIMRKIKEELLPSFGKYLTEIKEKVGAGEEVPFEILSGCLELAISLQQDVPQEFNTQGYLEYRRLRPKGRHIEDRLKS